MPVAGKYVNPILENVLPKRIGQFSKIAHFIMPVEYLPQPCNLFFIRLSTDISIGPFVFVMRADTILCFIVHLLRPNLYLNNLSLRPDHRSMERAITVGFR